MTSLLKSANHNETVKDVYFIRAVLNVLITWFLKKVFFFNWNDIEFVVLSAQCLFCKFLVIRKLHDITSLRLIQRIEFHGTRDFSLQSLQILNNWRKIVAWSVQKNSIVFDCSKHLNRTIFYITKELMKTHFTYLFSSCNKYWTPCIQQLIN